MIITAAPDIFYAEDTDGDGKADKREVLYTGFKEGNLQLRINGLRWGLDNWLHCANGWSGGTPAFAQDRRTGRPERPRPAHSTRITGVIELESGQSEFGRNPDDWGDWFGCDNSYPLFHFVLRRPVHAPQSARRRSRSQATALSCQPIPKVYPRSTEQKRYHASNTPAISRPRARPIFIAMSCCSRKRRRSSTCSRVNRCTIWCSTCSSETKASASPRAALRAESDSDF